MADFTNNAGTAVSGRTNSKRDLVVQQNLLKWVAEGKVFEAGFGVEDTAADSQAALDDTKVTFALQSPANSYTLVVPILLKLACVADGGALTAIDIAFTKPAGLCATANTLSGRALTSIHCMYQANPNKATPLAQALYGVATTFQLTSAALVAADYVDYHKGTIIDAALTTGLPNLGGGPSNVSTWDFLNVGAPRIMTNGASMLVYINTGSSDSTWFPYMQWAELTIDDLL